MQHPNDLRHHIQEGGLDARLCAVCGCEPSALGTKRARLLKLLDAYQAAFAADEEVGLFSGPGRTEMGGNHTDHQRGRVLAAAVDLDALACAGPSGDDVIRILSEGYPELRVDLSCLTPQKEEEGSSAALVRGIAARIRELGYQPHGFHACVNSTVLGGSGLSSSAAYEVMIGVILNHLYCGDELDMVQIAQIGQYAENVFFGKPCGLMDQLASAVGGIISIDFEDSTKPLVKKLEYSLSSSSYALCVIDSGADHADLTDEYAAIPREMGAVARFFGKDVLRQVPEEEIWSHLPELRTHAGDRAVLRAIHFYTDNQLAAKEAQMLENDDFYGFLRLVNQSGQSSAEHLQNLSCWSDPAHQALTLTIALARRLLKGDGAVRVHGGGFAGTVQAYVPQDRVQEFQAGMEAVLGKGCCHFLRVRPVGGAVLI